jgi:zinc D-Ala-D-Ala carboxypeptidase
LNNGGLPGKPAKFSVSASDDIPEAVRDTPDVKPQYRLKPRVVVTGLVGMGAIALILGILLAKPQSQPTVASSPNPNATSNQAQAKGTDQLLGHFLYQEAPATELKPITPDGQIQLRAAAAQKYQDMSAAASQAGVTLVALSGFRSVADQQHIFFDVKAERGQVATKRAEVSAPPGYSEHHTGYAIDLGDGNTPATNLSPDFDKTAAYQWLEKNAPFYSFELSFPKNNPQGVSYEPWHWRFVGDQNSLETFYRAKNSTPSLTTTTSPTSSPTPISSPAPSPTPIPSPTSSPTPVPSPAPSPTPIPSPTPSPTPGTR